MVVAELRARLSQSVASDALASLRCGSNDLSHLDHRLVNGRLGTRGIVRLRRRMEATDFLACSERRIAHTLLERRYACAAGEIEA